MKYIAIVILSILAAIMPAVANDKNSQNLPVPDDILEWTLAGWHIISIDKGDLNRDGVDDYAVVSEQDIETNNIYKRFPFPDKPPYILYDQRYQGESNAALRDLVVYIAQPDGRLLPQLGHSNWIDRADMGGVFGDPFEGISINRGSIIISSYGGAAKRWATKLRLRFDPKKLDTDDSLDWQIIGYTTTTIDAISDEVIEIDRNLLNFKVKITKSKHGKTTRETWDEIKDHTPIYLLY